jgi:hypothetical protein
VIEQPRILKFFYKMPVVLIGLVGYVYAISLIGRFKEDTTAITNAGFAILATLAALSFSFARVIETDQLKDRVMFAGERFLHGAVLVLVASILKYFSFLLFKLPIVGSLEWLAYAISLTIGIFNTFIFGMGIMFAHTGLRVLNDLLLARFTRHKDWDNLW